MVRARRWLVAKPTGESPQDFGNYLTEFAREVVKERDAGTVHGASAGVAVAAGSAPGVRDADLHRDGGPAVQGVSSDLLGLFVDGTIESLGELVQAVASLPSESKAQRTMSLHNITVVLRELTASVEAARGVL